jgi:hypothetical protein
MGLPCSASAASALTYNVTTTADSSAGSLREAITNASTNPGADTIQFLTLPPMGSGPLALPFGAPFFS